MTPIELDPLYEAKKYEEQIYSLWLRQAAFHSEPNPDKTPFVVMMPPPNVTGYLHIGHALNMTLQDIAIRYKRMKGFETLWLPGMDHAGIATQAVVERQIKEQGLTKEGLGRDEFVRRIWEWKEKYGGIILSQLKKLGVSADWDRLRFTLDEPYERAVKAAFVHYYEKGLLYKGQRITNWCPRCHTAISDIEVMYANEKGHLWYVRYPFADGSGSVTIATTRPETILGDAAVAVNPADPRYTDIVGKEVIVPIANRTIPVIADEAVLLDFGTGALKITPGHDPTDFEVGRRHNLPSMAVIGLDGLMNENALHYSGMSAIEAREKIVAEIDALGLLEKVDDYEHSVGHCSRCASTIEPIVTDQWYLRMKDLAARALEAEREGKVEVLPVKWRKVYESWLENINDWCVSRQLWWGHRIPVYHCEDCGEVIASVDAPHVCPKCGSSHITQESDVLDTWFSSALWPFATLGWPEQTPPLQAFYPTDALVTGRDIIFLWVARMIMMGLEFTGREPFSDVHITAIIQAPDGRRMSKSLGTGIDPLDLLEGGPRPPVFAQGSQPPGDFPAYGADAVRWGLLAMSSGQDVRFSEDKVAQGLQLTNKLWNAARLILLGVDPDVCAAAAPTEPEDRWILSRLEHAKAEVAGRIERYDFSHAALALYDFVYGELCDWYLELVKPRLRARAADLGPTLLHILTETVALAHPLIPFETEEIYSHIPGAEGMLAARVAARADLAQTPEEPAIAAVIEAVSALRAWRDVAEVKPGAVLTARLRAE